MVLEPKLSNPCCTQFLRYFCKVRTGEFAGDFPANGSAPGYSMGQ